MRKHLADAKYQETVGQMHRAPPPKSQSGTSGSRVRAAALARGDYRAGDARHKRLKRGRGPAAIVQAEDERRPTPRRIGPSGFPRPSGIRERPAVKAMPRRDCTPRSRARSPGARARERRVRLLYVSSEENQITISTSRVFLTLHLKLENDWPVAFQFYCKLVL